MEGCGSAGARPRTAIWSCTATDRSRATSADTTSGSAGRTAHRSSHGTGRFPRAMPGPGTFISVGKSLDQAIERVKRAESLGYDSVYVTHVAARDSLAVLMAY